MTTNDILLAPGEKGLYTRSFRPNLLLFWLRSDFLVTNKRIVVKYPNTILGVIPLGFEEKSMPMGSVAGVASSLRVKTGRLILATLIALFSFSMAINAIGSSFATFLLLMLIALAFGAIAANAIMATFVVTNNGGGSSEVGVSVLEKGALEAFKNKANEYIYSASAGGTSWNDAYANNSEGFQNQMGQR